MTRREFFEQVINSEVTQELKDFAVEEIAKLDKANARKREKTNPQTELFNATAQEVAKEVEIGKSLVASDLATASEISTQKASALLRRGVELGLFTVADVKIKGKGKVKSYTRTEKEVD